MLFGGVSNWLTARDAKDTERRIALELGSKYLKTYGADLSPELEAAILSSSAPAIVENIKTKQAGWTAANVMLAFIRSASKAQERSNVLTEIMFTHALKEAQDLDAEYAKTGKLKGPLHGVPVSLKDQINVKGVDSTIGYTQDVNSPADEDAVLVQVIRDAGGTPFTKTNVPQTMLSFECGNPLYGASRNPYDPSRTTGGSSGGEAGLLSSDGSPLGIGSDVGGSLRIPAHFSGCFALKPCNRRISLDGCVSSNPGSEVISVTMGGMGRSVADVELIHRVLFDASPKVAETSAVVPLAYREVKLPSKLRFGYFLTDGLCRASPACERAVLETVAALRKEGHEAVEITPPNPIEAMEFFIALTSAGRYDTLLSGLRGDPQEPSLWLITVGPKLPSIVRGILCWVAENVLGDAVLARLLRAARGKSVSELQEWQHKRDIYVRNARKELWETQGLDAVLCAPQATPALKHGDTKYLSMLAIGTILWNVIDSSVGLVPVTFVSSTLDALTPSWWSRQRASPGAPLVEGRVYGTESAGGGIYDAKEMEGLPVGVQIVAGHWQEEKVVELMKVVDRALGPRGFGPGEFAKKEAKREQRVY